MGLARISHPPGGPAGRAAGRALAVLALAVLLLGLLLAACRHDTAAAAGGAQPLLVEARQTGLEFQHDNGARGELWFAEIMGSGAALLDYDGDGDLDAFLVQGGPLDGTTHSATAPGDRLFRNDLGAGGRLAFRDVTRDAGLAPADGEPVSPGMGVAVGDVDGDGLPDLYVTRFGPNRLLRNRGDGTFEAVPGAGGADDPRWNASATFLDYDGDGLLDLYVTAYVDFTVAAHEPCRSLTGHPDYCKPQDYPPLDDRLFRNRGGGRFEDVSRRAGIAGRRGAGLGVVAGDLDGDGLPDLYVANDGMPNFLWRNRGDGSFEETALAAGLAVNARGEAEAGMGVAAGDADGDGELDLLVTHLALETSTLYRGLGGGLFEDATAAAGLAEPTWGFTGFGTAWADADGDGRPDLVIVNGGVERFPTLAALADPRPLAMPGQLLLNRGGGRFADAGDRTGPGLARRRVGRGLAAGDIDNDGDPDFLITENGGPARLLLGRPPPGGCWFGLRLLDRSGRDALGARVELALSDGTLRTAWVRTDGSYLSASDPRLLFAAPRCPQSVTVRWPDGTRTPVPVSPRRYATRRQPG